jgi:hypothetical protein
MNPTPILLVVLTLLFWIGVPAAGHADPSGAPAIGPDSSGIISGLNGKAAATSPISGASRPLRIGDRVAAGEEIRVDSGGTTELLWERRALFVLEGRGAIALQESKNGSGFVQVLDGTTRIVYSYNEGHPTDTLRVETPKTRVTLRGGIVEVAVESVRAGDQIQRTKFPLDRGPAKEIFRVIEGQARIELRAAETKSFLLKAGYEWSALSDQAGGEAIRPMTGQGVRPLATARDHHRVPAIQRMVRTHVEHALELERALSKPRDGNEAEEAGGVRGAIVATSLGIPLPAVTGSGATITATSVTPAVPAAPAGPVTLPTAPPAVVPPVVSPPVLPPVVSPVIPTPIIPTPNVTGLTPSQAGGINSLSLLRDVIQDISRGGNGNGRRGRDRD